MVAIVGAIAIGAVTAPDRTVVAQIAHVPKMASLTGNELVQAGWKFLKQGEHQQAIQHWEQAIAVFQRQSNWAGQARAYTGLGYAYLALASYPLSLEAHQQALSLYQKLGDRSKIASTFENLGITYRAAAQYQQAIEVGEKSLAIYQDLQAITKQIQALQNLGLDHYFLAHYSDAIANYQQALQLAQTQRDQQGEANALDGLAMVYKAMSEYGKAIESYQRSLKIYQALGDRHNEARVLLHGLADAHNLLFQEQKAHDYAQKAIAILRSLKVEKAQKAENLKEIGFAYFGMRQYDPAMLAYQQALQLYREMEIPESEAKILMRLGFIHTLQKRYDRAIVTYEKVLPVLWALNSVEEADSLSQLAFAYQNAKKYPKAIFYYKQALKIFQTTHSLKDQAYIFGQLGTIYRAMQQDELALQAYQRSLTLARSVQDRRNEAQTLSDLASLLQHRQQPAFAIVFYKQAVNVYERIRQDLQTLPRDTRESYISSVATAYRNLADLLLMRGRIPEAQEVIELLKVQEINSYGTANALATQVTQQLLEVQAVQQFETEIGRQLPLQLSDFTRMGQSLNAETLKQGGNQLGKQHKGNLYHLLAAQPNAIVIQNLVVGDKLWVLWTSPQKGTQAITVANVTATQLTETIQRFQSQLSRPSSNLVDLKTTSHQLYTWLLPPVLQTQLAHSPKQTLIFSLDHVTRYVPMAALYDGKQYLSERYSLVNIISAETDVHDRLSANVEDTSVLAVGVSKGLAGFSPLPHVSNELAAIVKEGDRGIYPGLKQLNEEFTLKTLRDHLKSYRIVHIATHGKFDPQSVTRSFLLLGDGQSLPVTEIEKLTNLTQTHLVVLSACQTGLSHLGKNGTEISGMSGYFLYRGAKSVLASLWSVDDASTSVLMQVFYKKLATGKLTKAEALRQAQQELRSGTIPKNSTMARSDITIQFVGDARSPSPTQNFSHPYYWAPFVLIGNGL